MADSVSERPTKHQLQLWELILHDWREYGHRVDVGFDEAIQMLAEIAALTAELAISNRALAQMQEAANALRAERDDLAARCEPGTKACASES